MSKTPIEYLLVFADWPCGDRDTRREVIGRALAILGSGNLESSRAATVWHGTDGVPISKNMEHSKLRPYIIKHFKEFEWTLDFERITYYPFESYVAAERQSISGVIVAQFKA